MTLSEAGAASDDDERRQPHAIHVGSNESRDARNANAAHMYCRNANAWWDARNAWWDAAWWDAGDAGDAQFPAWRVWRTPLYDAWTGHGSYAWCTRAGAKPFAPRIQASLFVHGGRLPAPAQKEGAV